METLFTWIHLSDLHVRAASAGAAHAKIRAGLRRDLVERAARPPDAIVVTGDVAWSGAREEYAEATAWLLDATRALGVGLERVLVVPGNHDVDRTVERSPTAARLFQSLRQGRKPLDATLSRPRERGPLARRLKPYLTFAAAFGPTASAPEDELSWSHRLPARGGLSVRFVGLNTALLSADSADDDDRGALRLGGAQLERALASVEDGELVVVLGHHPLRGAWLADEDGARAWTRAHAHVHLSGHVHDAHAEEARAGAGEGPLWIAAGASSATAAAKKQAGGAPRRLGYSAAAVVRGPDGALRLRVWPRCWSTDEKGFVADEGALPQGGDFAEHPLRFSLAATPEPIPGLTPEPIPGLTPEPIPGLTPEPIPGLTPGAPIPGLTPGAPIPGLTPGVPHDGAAVIAPITMRAGSAAPAPPPASIAPRTAPASGSGLFEGPGGLPAHPIDYFVGRGAEMAALRAALADPAATCVVAIGLGGVGKTSLVQHFAATEARALFAESAWIDARDLLADLGRVAKRFGWRDADRSPTVEEASRFLRKALASRSALLVIDNVDPGVADVRALPVPGGRSRTVITSRIVTLHEDLGGRAKTLALGSWDDATCRAHFREVVPGLAGLPDAELDALARRVGGLPLAVRLLAKLLLRPDVTVPRLLARLERDPIETLDLAAKGPDRGVVSTLLASVEGLGEIVRGILLALASCAPSTRAEVVARVAGVQPDVAALALEGLAEQSLVEWIPEAERPFRMHDVVRLLLRQQPGATEADAAHAAFAREHAEAHADPKDWRRLERDLPEVLAAMDRSLREGDAGIAWDTLSKVIALLDRRGRYGELADACTRVLRALPEGGLTASAVLGTLGLCCCSLGEIPRAIGCLELSLELAEALGSPEGQAKALGGLGRCCAVLGDLKKAIAHHQRAGAIHELLGLPKLHANDLGNLGFSFRRIGEVASAIEHLEQALALQEQLGLLEGQAEVLGGLGLCFRDIGEVTGAIDYFQRALAIHEELGQRVGQATMLGNLGNCHRAVGDLGKATEHLGRALAIYEELGLVEGQAAALGNLGACHRAAGEIAKAKDHFERSLGLLRRANLPDDHPHVERVLAALGQRGAAREEPRPSGR